MSTTKQPTTRIYVVKKEGKMRLVRATHPLVAYGHVYGAQADEVVRVANQSALATLLESGVKIENAGAPA